jgi:hypothetical protein
MEKRLPDQHSNQRLRFYAVHRWSHARAKVGYRHAIFKRKTPGSKECRGFLLMGLAAAVEKRSAQGENRRQGDLAYWRAKM